jgi:hypothetical protein
VARRPISTLSLSLLDCLCCGFGSVILIFMIISNRVTNASQEALAELESQALRLSVQTEALGQEVASEEAQLDELSAAFRAKSARLRAQRAQVARLEQLVAEKQGFVSASKRSVQQALAAKAAQPSAAPPETRGPRGQRELVTGLRMDGKRTLILLDASGSMLDRHIANIVLLRNMPPERQRRAAKWQQAVSTVDWLLARRSRSAPSPWRRARWSRTAPGAGSRWTPTPA